MHLLAIYKERLYDLYVKNLNTVQIYDTMYVHTYEAPSKYIIIV